MIIKFLIKVNKRYIITIKHNCKYIVNRNYVIFLLKLFFNDFYKKTENYFEKTFLFNYNSVSKII